MLESLRLHPRYSQPTASDPHAVTTCFNAFMCIAIDSSPLLLLLKSQTQPYRSSPGPCPRPCSKPQLRKAPGCLRPLLAVRGDTKGLLAVRAFGVGALLLRERHQSPSQGGCAACGHDSSASPQRLAVTARHVASSRHSPRRYRQRGNSKTPTIPLQDATAWADRGRLSQAGLAAL